MNSRTRSSTRAVHGGIKRSQYGETAEALFLTQGFVYDSAEQAEARFIEAEPDEFVYARYGNPTVRMFEDRMASLQEMEDAFATASGMAAVSSTLFSMLAAGDRIVSARALFGSCLFIVENALPRFGVDVELVDGTDLDQWEKAVTPGTSVIFLESVSNPTLEIVDVQALRSLADRVGAKLVVDNALITPILFREIERLADVVIYSATKHIDGQGRCLGGIVLGTKHFIRKVFEPFHKHVGGALSPFNAWMMLKGLETLTLRCMAQSGNALTIATQLEQNTKVARVLYPMLDSHPQSQLARQCLRGGGTVLSIELAGGKDAAFRFMNALEIFRISNNFGDAKSLVTHPATTTHQRLTEELRRQLGISPGLVRISVGLEDVQDLIADLAKALDAA